MSVPSDWRTLTRIGTVRLMTTTKVPENGFYVNANVVVTPDDERPADGDPVAAAAGVPQRRDQHHQPRHRQRPAACGQARQ